VQLPIRFRKEEVLITQHCIKTDSVRVSRLHFGGTFLGQATLSLDQLVSSAIQNLISSSAGQFSLTVCHFAGYGRLWLQVGTSAMLMMCGLKQTDLHFHPWRHRGAAELRRRSFFNLGPRSKWTFNVTLRLLNPEEEPKYAFNRSWVVLWAGPDDLENTKSLVPAGIRTSDRPTRILVTKLTALRGLYYVTHLTLVGSLTLPSLNYVLAYLLTYSMEQSFLRSETVLS
jgi:hypothetical protein